MAAGFCRLRDARLSSFEWRVADSSTVWRRRLPASDVRLSVVARISPAALQETINYNIVGRPGSLHGMHTCHWCQSMDQIMSKKEVSACICSKGSFP